MSTIMAQANLMNNASIAVAGKVMDVAQQNGDQLARMMETTNVTQQSVTPHIGSNIDIKL